ncbi:5-carboxymethyl-2-hydroxymuconate Delta-isomerase [Amorphus sp. 3PC139-8]|uniref:5-carboxymethyl-2-hydroxymuconate Delta-isomerase n=1 Tax=Amorphus sp. 3PC139-8 TaxID=2735676 RepID=UPI00345DFC83
MPHLVLEYSDTLDPAPDVAVMMRSLCDAVVETGIVRRADLKARAIPYADFLLDDGSTGFVHLTLSLLEGRTPEKKEALAIACRAALVETCPQADAISVDVRDMDATAYKKHVKHRDTSA